MTDPLKRDTDPAPARQSDRWLVLVFALAGLMSLAYGLYGAADTLAFATRASTAEARVLRIEVVPTTRRGQHHHAVVAFRTAWGDPVEATVRSANGWVRAVPGERLAVRYDPARPVRVETDGLGLLLFGSLLALPFGGALLGIALAWRGGGGGADGDGPGLWPIALPAGAWVLLTALYFAVNETAAAQAWLRGSALAEARIVEVRAVAPGRSGDRPLAVFRTMDGREVRVQLAEGGDRPAPGSVVRMRYAPAEPERAVQDRGASHWLRAGVSWAVFALLAAGGVGLLAGMLRARRRNAGA